MRVVEIKHLELRSEHDWTSSVIAHTDARGTVRGGRPTYDHLPTSRFRFIVDPTSVETLFSISPLALARSGSLQRLSSRVIMALSSLAAARCRGVRPCSSGSSSAPEARANHQHGSRQVAHNAGTYGAAAASVQVYSAVCRAAARRPLVLVSST